MWVSGFGASPEFLSHGMILRGPVGKTTPGRLFHAKDAMQDTEQEIEYVSALAGAGKTYALVRYAHQLASRGFKVMFVQPTRQLIDMTVQNELDGLPTVRRRVIHSG